MLVSRTFWLTLTNVLLGLAVLFCLVGSAVAILYGVCTRRAKRNSRIEHMDREMGEAFGYRASPTVLAGRRFIDAPLETLAGRGCHFILRLGSALRRKRGLQAKPHAPAKSLP